MINQQPADLRLQVFSTVAEQTAFNTAQLEDGVLSYVKASNTVYAFDKATNAWAAISGAATARQAFSGHFDTNPGTGAAANISFALTGAFTTVETSPDWVFHAGTSSFECVTAGRYRFELLASLNTSDLPTAGLVFAFVPVAAIGATIFPTWTPYSQFIAQGTADEFSPPTLFTITRDFTVGERIVLAGETSDVGGGGTVLQNWSIGPQLTIIPV